MLRKPIITQNNGVSINTSTQTVKEMPIRSLFRLNAASLHIAIAFSTLAALTAYGDHSNRMSNEIASAKTVTPIPAQAVIVAPKPSLSSARIARIELAQTMVYPAGDPQLVLVKNKDVVLIVKATTSKPSEPKPTGTVRVEDGMGRLLKTITLTAPTGPIPTSAPVSPSFATAYSATIPASLINSGVIFKVSLANGQAATTVMPRVGAENPITLMAIPVAIGSTRVAMPSGMASYFLPKAPVGKVTEQIHATFTSSAITNFPRNDAEWRTAMSYILGEIDNLHTSEHASDRTYYYGFLPKTTYGVMGLGYVTGNAAVGVGASSTWRGSKQELDTMVHELGHNLSLNHVACGGAAGADPAYPYPDGLLGMAGRYIWGYNLNTKTFVDPTDTRKHDAMSYCDGDTFSDYHYRKMQKYLTPADALYVGQSKVDEAPQELLLISGKVDANGARINPLKAFQGLAKLPESGPYKLILRTAGANGSIKEVVYPFAAKNLDHQPDLSMFSFSIPNPGQVLAVEIRRANDNAVLHSVQSTAQRSIAPTTSPSSTTIVEKDGELTITWDAQTYPHLMVTHVDTSMGNKRTTLTVDAKDGQVKLPIQDVPKGGHYELSFSDGLNTKRMEKKR